MAPNPRNLALSVCRMNFPRFSDTSGKSATSMMDPSAARILDPLRRSWPLTKPPSAAYTLTIRGCSLMIMLESNAVLIHLWLQLHTLMEPRQLCWNIVNMQLHLKQFNQTVSSSSVPAHSEKLIGYSDPFKGGTISYCGSLHVGRFHFHFLLRNFRRLEDSVRHKATASCVNRNAWSFCHWRAHLPRAVWLRDIFSITFLAFVAKLFHLGLEGLSCCNETIELELFLLQFFVLKLKLLQLQPDCLSLGFFLQALRFMFLLPFPFPQSFPLRLNLLHLQCMFLSPWFFFLHALRFNFLLPFSQGFALKLKLLHLQCECLSLRFFLLQALTFLCQLLDLNVKLIMFCLQTCLGGSCCLMPATKKLTLKKSQGLLSSF